MNTNIQLWRFRSSSVLFVCYFLFWVESTKRKQQFTLDHKLMKTLHYRNQTSATSVPLSQSLPVDVAHICHSFVAI